MSNLFDALQNNTFNVVSHTMGDPASWTNTDSLLVVAKVLFKDPTHTAKALKQDYDPEACMMEYKLGDFVGLRERVDAGAEEIVNIAGADYGVTKITAEFDGKTFYAHLVKL